MAVDGFWGIPRRASAPRVTLLAAEVWTADGLGRVGCKPNALPRASRSFNQSADGPMAVSAATASVWPLSVKWTPSRESDVAKPRYFGLI